MFDDKRYVLDNGIYMLAYFHKDCNKKEEIKKIVIQKIVIIQKDCDKKDCNN